MRKRHLSIIKVDQEDRAHSLGEETGGFFNEEAKVAEKSKASLHELIFHKKRITRDQLAIR
jgi:hypothetical protein